MTARPLSEQAFLVLTALAGEPLHGYAIVKAVAGLTDDSVRLSVGTLYGILDRLTADGLVQRDRDELHQGRQRRYYKLTDPGAEALQDEAERLAAHVRVATEQLRIRRLRPQPMTSGPGARPGAWPPGIPATARWQKILGGLRPQSAGGAA